MRGKTFIISGPSGVGKSTVLSALLEKRKNLYFSVSATTRDPRPGELDGIHYHFMDAESFRKWIAMDQFLEYAEYVGNFYGTPKRFVDEAMDKGQDVILDIEVQGALQVTSKRPDTVKIFIAPPSWKELERRLKDRGTDDPEKVQKRLLRAKVEFQIVEDNGKLIWKCPKCGNTDQDKMNVARRTCGYIGTQFWNQGRTQEIRDRVLHL